MTRIGWIQAALGMFQAVIVAVILYGMESYSQLNKRQEEEIESIHRAALIDGTRLDDDD